MHIWIACIDMILGGSNALENVVIDRNHAAKYNFLFEKFSIPFLFIFFNTEYEICIWSSLMRLMNGIVPICAYIHIGLHSIKQNSSAWNWNLS